MTALAHEAEDDAPVVDVVTNLLALSADELRALRERIEELDEWLVNRSIDGERG